MSKLKHTTSEFDSAIRKVRANYADVTNVNATASDVVEGKVFKSANKELVTGTLGNAEITPTIRIEGSVLGDQVSDYPIKATPSFKVKTNGVIESTTDGQNVTKYIRVEQKTCTPKDVEQDVVPTTGRLLEQVTIEAAKVLPVIEKMYIPTLKLTKPTDKTSTSYGAYVPSGNTHNNVYCKNGKLDMAKVYLFLVGSTINDINQVTIINPETKNILPTTIILNPGDSITSSGNTYAPAGVLTLTTEGRLTFKHTADFYSGTGNTTWLLWINGNYYLPCVDYTVFSHDYNGVGSYSSRAQGFYGGNVAIGEYSSNTVTYYRPKALLANLTNVYFYFYWNSTSRYDKIRLTFNYGTYLGFFVEQED